MILHIFLCGVNFNLWITTVVHSLIQSYNSFSFPSIWDSLSVKKNILWTKQLTVSVLLQICAEGKTFFYAKPLFIFFSLCFSFGQRKQWKPSSSVIHFSPFLCFSLIHFLPFISHPNTKLSCLCFCVWALFVQALNLLEWKDGR